MLCTIYYIRPVAQPQRTGRKKISQPVLNLRTLWYFFIEHKVVIGTQLEQVNQSGHWRM